MRTTLCRIAIALFFVCAAMPVSAEVIGGSVLRSPPQFQLDSFLVGLSGSWEEAYPFQVISGSGWLPECLEVPLYHDDGMAGSSAAFSICSDASGKPGSQLATFTVSGITIEQQVYSLTPSYVTGPLQGDTTYWLVGSNTGAGQVNWNVDESIGNYNRVHRIDGGDWVAQSGLCNISAFAIFGSPVPEPSGLVLLIVGTASLLTYAWQRRPAKSNP